jgi:hypothetical protein
MVSLCACLIAASASLLCAEGAAAKSAPLPLSESLVYSRKIGSAEAKVEMRTRLVESNGAAYYELSVLSPEESGTYRLDRMSLLEVYSDVTTKSEDATIRRVTTLVEGRAAPAKDEVLVAGAGQSMTQTLRAFPWSEKAKAKLAFVGSGRARSDYRFELSVLGKETLEAAGRKIECWKAQLVVGGFLGNLVGATKLWYSVEYPHYLVRSESPSGMGGSSPTILTLESYSSVMR